jgi:hypothetical protein
MPETLLTQELENTGKFTGWRTMAGEQALQFRSL